MAFNGRVRAVFVRAHERLMSAPRSVVLAAAFVASVLVVVACADSLTERGVLPVVSWPMVLDGVRSLADEGVVDACVLAGVEGMAGVSR